MSNDRIFDSTVFTSGSFGGLGFSKSKKKNEEFNFTPSPLKKENINDYNEIIYNTFDFLGVEESDNSAPISYQQPLFSNSHKEKKSKILQDQEQEFMTEKDMITYHSGLDFKNPDKTAYNTLREVYSCDYPMANKMRDIKEKYINKNKISEATNPQERINPCLYSYNILKNNFFPKPYEAVIGNDLNTHCKEINFHNFSNDIDYKGFINSSSKTLNNNKKHKKAAKGFHMFYKGKII